nr:hypothetical protein [Methylomarinum sp. Ch1-1]MDP4521273.1 hypothetical protein [Methylomarinum sp. Ch1-1]
MKRIKNRCASYRQHTLAPVGWIKRSGSTNVGRLREASCQTTPSGFENPPYSCDAVKC